MTYQGRTYRFIETEEPLRDTDKYLGPRTGLLFPIQSTWRHSNLVYYRQIVNKADAVKQAQDMRCAVSKAKSVLADAETRLEAALTELEHAE